MSQISIQNLTFAYAESYDNIFEHVSFAIDTDWKLGFIGRNGRGKTTFLRLLMSRYEYEGRIHATVSFAYFPYEVEEKSVWTLEVAQCIHPALEEWQLMRELRRLELDESVLYRAFSSLSNGEQTKVLLAVLFCKENSFLLIDEPTNHLDAHGRRVVADYLRGKRGFILVSHDRAFLDGCIDHVLSINKTNITIEQGNFSSWYLNKTRQDSFEFSQNERLKKEIKRLNASAKQAGAWSDKVEGAKYASKNGGEQPPDRGYVGARSAAMMKRSKAIESRKQAAAEEKSALLRDIEQTAPLKLAQLAYHAPVLATLRDLAICYGQNPVNEPVSFTVERGDRIALCGANGSGKSSILKLILGQDVPCAGFAQTGSRLRCSYVAQDTAFLSGSLTEFAQKKEVDESLFKAILRKLGFERVQFEKDMRDFSGGQKKKVLIAASLCEPSHLLVWDEPLNFIDVVSRMQLEQLLLEYCPTILFVEHDQTFCTHVATKTIFLM